MKRTEDSLRDLWDNTNCTNIWITGVPEEDEKTKGYEKIFEEIIVENFPLIYLDFCVSSLFLHLCSSSLPFHYLFLFFFFLTYFVWDLLFPGFKVEFILPFGFCSPKVLPGESQGWRSLVGFHLWGCTESDTTEATCCWAAAAAARFAQWFVLSLFWVRFVLSFCLFLLRWARLNEVVILSVDDSVCIFVLFVV